MYQKVTLLLEQALEENSSLFLIDMIITDQNKISITIDGDLGVTVEDCIAVSRAIEHNLDREEEDFSLEVMSAGVTEGLKLPRQFKKNIGRTLKVKTADSRVIEGDLMKSDDEGIELHWKAREPKPIGKGKITVEKTAVLPYKEIIEAKVMVKFN
ncbi:ribosome assembly cofactor RimP [Ulvibacter antarcticus]|uniref:Ribosome maturation factor RimP n=1 Tax=Ulvibacter antarcticus TaxID=442714 RepID=A0A3L9Z0T0_9FLAO|nr:ribosome assembly cofactor RimP [Ulvibacter antarcticus]RMA65710.1 ribosome maturation factor RimP [Ulvibacter antarcticus]